MIKKSIKRELIVCVEYLLLSMAIMWPIWKPGYVFAIDMYFTPTLRLPDIYNGWLFEVSLVFLNHLLPSWFLQKILLLSVFVISGLVMHYTVPVSNRWAKYYAGLLYMFNPFTYSRMLYGQYLLIFAYALLPLAIYYFFKAFNGNRKIYFVFLLIVSFIIIHLSSHVTVLMLLSYGLIFAWYSIKDWRHEHYLSGLKRLLLIGTLLFVTGSYWILPLLRGQGATANYVLHKIESTDLISFQTETDQNYGLLWNVAAMYGFWGDREGRYINQKEMMLWWYPLSIIFFSLMIIGFFSLIKPRGGVESLIYSRRLAITMLTLYIVAFVFALGIAYEPLKGFFFLLYDKMPLFKGYREPQKFVALMVLVYAFLGAHGVEYSLNLVKRIKLEKMRKLVAPILSGTFLVLPLLYSPGMFNGFRHQLIVTDYPVSWYEVNETLNIDQDDFRILFLPWHQYMSFNFLNGKVVANPAERFFDRSVIAGDNAEFGTVYSTSDRPESKYIEREVIAKRDKLIDVGRVFLPLNIKYIILADGADYLSYDFLDRQIDLKLVYQQEGLKVYLNQAWKPLLDN